MSETQRISENARCLDDFLLDVEAANRADATVRFYRDKLETFLELLAEEGVTTPDAITPPVLRRFLVTIKDGRTSGGIHAFWRAIRAFIRFMVREDILDRNPLDKIRRLEVDQPLLDPIEPKVIEALLDTCDSSELGKRDRAIFLTLLDSGMRAGELTALTVGDVDQVDGNIAIHKSKSRKGRIAFISAQTRRAVRSYLRCRGAVDASEPLFLAYATTGDTGPLTYDGLRAIVTRHAKQAGIKPPSLHSFRRTFALSMLRSGADVISLSRLMGHGSLPVIQRYLKQMKEDLGAVHRQHSPVDSLKRDRRRRR
jgi:site-specific recombinase XerD